jgi:hypothetical protein
MSIYCPFALQQQTFDGRSPDRQQPIKPLVAALENNTDYTTRHQSAAASMGAWGGVGDDLDRRFQRLDPLLAIPGVNVLSRVARRRPGGLSTERWAKHSYELAS